MQQRPEDLSGDYEYDLAHEVRRPRGAGGDEPRSEPSGPAPGRPRAESGEDLSYDEAHDF